jgi:transcriptional regulator with XRE-family HTH domain
MPRTQKPLEVPKGKELAPEIAFAQILRERRNALGLTQVDLENDTELDRSYISKLELGKRQICLRGFIHIAQKLKMEPEELMAELMKRVRSAP